jgi:hypothetical protein
MAFKKSVSMLSNPQTIDPVYLLQPFIFVFISFGLVLYWWYSRRFTPFVILYSVAAYAGAIALKYVVQILTAKMVFDTFGAASLASALYLGLQTVVFEVGGAFLVAHYAVSHGKLEARDAEAYAIGLAFWENGIILGLMPLINLAAIYVLLASNPSRALFQQIHNTQLYLFSPPVEVLTSFAWSTLERISSLLAHFSWGYLCVFAAVFRRWRYLAIALPRGLLDALVPFAGSVSIPVFESLLFLITAGFLITALAVTWNLRRQISWTSKQGLIIINGHV